MLNDLKQFISQKDNHLIFKNFDVYADLEVDDFIKEKKEWDLAMAVTEISMDYFSFSGDFEIVFNEHHLQNANHCP